MTTRRMRQFVVTHRDTGLETLVNGMEWLMHDGSWSAADYSAARQAGHRYVVDCDVRLVKRGQETPLPFDELPLILRRPGQAGRP